jgi:uncharacterized protein with von Willebrand factor type A (vWA) domain
MRPPEVAALCAAVALGRALREAGVPASVDRELLFCRTLAEVDPRSRSQMRWAARASFVTGPEQVDVFEQVFARFWDGDELLVDRPRVEHGESDPRMPGPQHGGESLPQHRIELRSGHLLGGEASRASSELPTAPGDRDGRGERRGALAAYSPDERVSNGDPLAYGSEELREVRELAEALRRVSPERRSRRLRASRREGRLDVRRTLRAALTTDGEPLRPAFVAPSRCPRRLLFVCDVSGSMDRYSRAVLGSLQAAVTAGIRAEAFVFATRLTRVTGELSGHDVARALERAREAVPDWSGGTRIGHALREFNERYAGLGLARGAVVIVVSDGWDRGDPELLVRELERLRLQCRRLAWLNPRPATLHAQPLAVGMRAALPHVDDYVPGHDPRAARNLAALIRTLGSSRPARRQRAVALGAR